MDWGEFRVSHTSNCFEFYRIEDGLLSFHEAVATIEEELSGFRHHIGMRFDHLLRVMVVIYVRVNVTGGPQTCAEISSRSR